MASSGNPYDPYFYISPMYTGFNPAYQNVVIAKTKQAPSVNGICSIYITNISDITTDPNVDLTMLQYETYAVSFGAMKRYIQTLGSGGVFVPISGGTMTGNLIIPPTTNFTPLDATVQKSYVDNSLLGKLSLTGGTLTGNLDVPATTGATPSTATVQKAYVDSSLAGKLSLTGGTLAGGLNMGTTNKIIFLADPTINPTSMDAVNARTLDKLPRGYILDQLVINSVTTIDISTVPNSGTKRKYVCDMIIGFASTSSPTFPHNYSSSIEILDNASSSVGLSTTQHTSNSAGELLNMAVTIPFQTNTNYTTAGNPRYIRFTIDSPANVTNITGWVRIFDNGSYV